MGFLSVMERYNSQSFCFLFCYLAVFLVLIFVIYFLTKQYRPPTKRIYIEETDSTELLINNKDVEVIYGW
jgi:hypothetical protein